MSMVFRTLAGDGVVVAPQPKCGPRPSDRSMRERRNALWLHAITVGMWDPDLRRNRRYGICEVARLWGLTPKAVRHGIQQARETMELVAAHAS